MQYVSTRGAAPVLSFDDVLLAGLARDGGLYVPESWPQLPPGLVAGSADRPYEEVAVEVMWPFVEGVVGRSDFEVMVEEAYTRFDHPEVVPLRRLSDGTLAGRAVPRADAGLQGPAAPARRAALRPRPGPAGGAGHDRRCHLGRHRLGRHRGLPRPRGDRDLHPPPGRSGLRGAASPDDHRGRSQRPQHRHRRHLRRLPGPREGAVRRHRVPGSPPPVGRELDQLGAGDGPDPVLRDLGRAVRRTESRSPSRCRPATSATSWPATGPSGWVHRWAGW